MTLPIAHAGHWVLYVIPVLVVLVVVIVSSVRERRAAARVEAEREEEP